MLPPSCFLVERIRNILNALVPACAAWATTGLPAVQGAMLRRCRRARPSHKSLAMGVNGGSVRCAARFVADHRRRYADDKIGRDRALRCFHECQFPCGQPMPNMWRQFACHNDGVEHRDRLQVSSIEPSMEWFARFDGVARYLIRHCLRPLCWVLFDHLCGGQIVG